MIKKIAFSIFYRYCGKIFITLDFLFIKYLRNIIMNDEKDLIEFDDNEAISFIHNTLTDEQKQRIDDDTIQYVLDLICEYYDQNGLIEEDTVDEAEIAEDDIFNFVCSLARKEGVITISDDDIKTILDGEYKYGLSIGIYSDVDEQ